MNHGLKTVIAACLLCWVLMPGTAFGASADDIIVVANPNVPTDTLAQDEIQSIFLGEIVKWSDNTMITVVILKNQEVHELFLKKYIKRTAFQFNNVWRRILFTGKGKPPIRMKSQGELLEYVSKTAGAIGYVSSGLMGTKTVKVVEE